MRKVSEVAIDECVAELRAACRRPIEEGAVGTLVSWLRPNFERILDRIDGGQRWADHGQKVRNNSRHLGALADFFANHAVVDVVGVDELSQAFAMSRADCTVRAERTPFAWDFCNPPDVRLGVREAEKFLRTLTPPPAAARRVG